MVKAPEAYRRYDVGSALKNKPGPLAVGYKREV
jgi:hypothetical protein